jgi:hypothetical protein
VAGSNEVHQCCHGIEETQPVSLLDESKDPLRMHLRSDANPADPDAGLGCCTYWGVHLV